MQAFKINRRFKKVEPRERHLGRVRNILVALVLTSGLAACGGGGSSAAYEDPRQVPASAVASIEAFIRYLQNLAINNLGEPLDVSQITPPTSDTLEPVPL